MKKTVMAEKGPPPAGPYSHAVVANGFVFISGQGPVDPETGTMPDAFADQVRQTELQQHAELALITPVGREVVTAQDSIELGAQHLDQHVAAPGRQRLR